MTDQQHNPPHVGGLIYRTYIEPFKLVTGNKIAAALGVSNSTFSRLVKGDTDLSPDMALRLSLVLGRSPESWMKIQQSYDLWLAKQKINMDGLSRLDFEAAA